MTPDAPWAPDEPEILHSPAPPPTPPPPPGRSRVRWQHIRQLSDRTPLRTKLITAVLALMMLALVATSVASVWVLRENLVTQHDAQMVSLVNQINNNHVAPGNNVGYVRPNGSGQIIAIQVPGQSLQWYQQQGGGPFPGVTMNMEPLPVLPTKQGWADATGGRPFTVQAQHGPDSWRVIAETVSYQVNTPTGLVNEPGTLVVATDLGNINGTIQRMIVFDALVSFGILVILAGVAVAVVRANLRPLDDIELTAGQIAAGHLDHRIPERDPRTEIGSLGRSLNTMLSQIETAFRAQQESEDAAHRSEERMRRFIADASHELRTPLTTLRGFAEYYRQRGGVQEEDTGMTPAELDRIMRRLESEAARMGLLVEDLLQLARLDQQRPLEMGLVDLLTLAADAVQDSRMVAPERTIELTVAPGAAFLVMGDEQRLRQVIGNLVTNARVHTPPEASIRVAIASGTLATGAPAVVLDVIDDGPGMTTEQAQHIFERFYRADAARNRASGGTGLGLAIVAGLVGAHGGEVSVTTAPGRGADFTVRLPLSPDALSPDDEADDQPYDERGSLHELG
jgi:two-component system, OmpR family, sensor kinase